MTNDIYTKEDAQFLSKRKVLPAGRIRVVETSGCQHIAIREDDSMNLAAVEDLINAYPGLDIVFIESGEDNLSATFSPKLADLMIYVVDVSGGGQDTKKGRSRDHSL